MTVHARNLNVGALLGLPAAERLELADILRRSVGCPANIETLELPAWQRDHFDRLLRQCGPEPED
ncbi:MAG: hypothetical protein JNK40_14790 [Chromatiales bacterium]|nr:hypothetical protein [Chromatiales bacterium]